jgi:preprotein translocase subunit SecE
MKTIQKTAGIVLVVLGVVLGFGLGIYFIDLGVKDLRKGLYLEGLLKCPF